MMQWPNGMKVRPIQIWPGELTHDRRRSNFAAAWSDTIALLGRELRAISAHDIVLQIAMTETDFRIDGYPRAQAKAAHPGVILSLDSNVGPLSWPCDTFTTWQDNIRGIALAMEALRKVDRYGVTKRGEQYRGWRAIESSAGTFPTADAAERFVLKVAKVEHGEGLTIASASRRAKANAHPDRNDGDRTEFDKVDAAVQLLEQAGRL